MQNDKVSVDTNCSAVKQINLMAEAVRSGRYRVVTFCRGARSRVSVLGLAGTGPGLDSSGIYFSVENEMVIDPTELIGLLKPIYSDRQQQHENESRDDPRIFHGV